MNSRENLNTRREILLIGLHARRLGKMRHHVALITDGEQSGYPRSAVMRFILRQPHICFWAVGELLPLLSGKRKRGSLRRFTQACCADYYPLADIG